MNSIFKNYDFSQAQALYHFCEDQGDLQIYCKEFDCNEDINIYTLKEAIEKGIVIPTTIYSKFEYEKEIQ